MAGFISMVWAGFNRYRKRRKNLTIVLSIVFLLLFFFSNVFSVLNDNLHSYWIESFYNADMVVSSDSKSVDVMSPVDPAHYFDYGQFAMANPALTEKMTPRLRFGALLAPHIGDDELSNGLVVIGIDPVLDPTAAAALKVREGAYFTQGKDEILLPQAIAGNIGVEIGQDVILAVMTKTGYYNMEKATLVGIIELPPAAFVFGTYLGYVQLAQAQRLMDTDQVSEVVVATGALGPMGRVNGAFKFSPALSNLSTSKAISMAYLLLQIIIVVFLAVFSIGIVYQNVVMMNEERVAEIGIYLSYGAKPSWIQSLMLTELALYTLYCGLIGGLGGLVLMGSLTALGLTPFDMVSDLMLGGQGLNLWPSPWLWVQTTLVLLAFVIGAALKPTINATQSTAIIKLFRK